MQTYAKAQAVVANAVSPDEVASWQGDRPRSHTKGAMRLHEEVIALGHGGAIREMHWRQIRT